MDPLTLPTDLTVYQTIQCNSAMAKAVHKMFVKLMPFWANFRRMNSNLNPYINRIELTFVYIGLFSSLKYLVFISFTTFFDFNDLYKFHFLILIENFKCLGFRMTWRHFFPFNPCKTSLLRTHTHTGVYVLACMLILVPHKS